MIMEFPAQQMQVPAMLSWRVLHPPHQESPQRAHTRQDIRAPTLMPFLVKFNSVVE